MVKTVNEMYNTTHDDTSHTNPDTLFCIVN